MYFRTDVLLFFSSDVLMFFSADVLVNRSTKVRTNVRTFELNTIKNMVRQIKIPSGLNISIPGGEEETKKDVVPQVSSSPIGYDEEAPEDSEGRPAEPPIKQKSPRRGIDVLHRRRNWRLRWFMFRTGS